MRAARLFFHYFSFKLGLQGNAVFAEMLNIKLQFTWNKMRMVLNVQVYKIIEIYKI